MTARDLGDALRRHREAADVTRAELARASGVNRSTVGAIERGQPTREITVRRLVAALVQVAPDVDVDAAAVVDELLFVAGVDGLAPPPRYPDHAADREVRRHLQASPEVARLDRYARRARAALTRAHAAGDADEMLRIARSAWPDGPWDGRS